MIYRWPDHRKKVEQGLSQPPEGIPAAQKLTREHPVTSKKVQQYNDTEENDRAGELSWKKKWTKNHQRLNILEVINVQKLTTPVMDQYIACLEKISVRATHAW